MNRIATFKPADKIAYIWLSIYSVLHLFLIFFGSALGGYAIDLLDFKLAIAFLVVIPIVAIITMISYQLSARPRRFSVVANVVLSLGLVGWWFITASVIGEASGAV